MYFGFKKIKEIIHIYKETRVKYDNTSFSQHTPKLLAWLTNLVQKRYNHVIVDSK